MRRRSSVRARTTIAATLIFGVALTTGGVGLVTVLRSTMTDNVDIALRLRASDIGALLEAGAQPKTVAIVNEEDSFIQIVNGERVVASSVNVEGQGAVSGVPPGTVYTANLNPVDDSAFRVFVSSVLTSTGPLTVIVGNTLAPVNNTVRVTLITLAIGLPLLSLFAGAMTWIVVGRALRPVEGIRAEVAEIGATDLHRRVPPSTTDDEIGRLADTMNHMLDRIESGSIRQRRFVSNASHELRTPIATIRHQLEVALQHQGTTDWPSVAGDVLDEDVRMQRLVDDLLWLARNDEGDRGRTRLIDLDEVARNQARRQAPRSSVSTDLSEIGAGQVRGNEDELTRVVQNLVDNALRHAESKIAVIVRSDGSGHVVVHIDDDGPGVPEKLREEIFERFTRGDEARTRDDGGAGLGLAIAGEIAARHRGMLTVARSPLGGARFTLTLPDARKD